MTEEQYNKLYDAYLTSKNNLYDGTFLYTLVAIIQGLEARIEKLEKTKHV